MNEEQFTGTSGAARRLRVCAEMVRQLERTGKLAVYLKTEDGVRVFRIEDVEKLAAQREVGERQVSI